MKETKAEYAGLELQHVTGVDASEEVVEGMNSA